MKEHLGNKLAYYHFQFDDQALNYSLIATSWRNNFDLSICFRELLIEAGTGVVSRFVSENERGSSDINTVSSSHVETVVLLSRAYGETIGRLSE